MKIKQNSIKSDYFYQFFFYFNIFKLNYEFIENTIMIKLSN